MARTRNYACIVYPDSAPDNWIGILKEQKVPCLISPLHDKDINPTGEPKKPHYHVIVMYDSVKTMEQAREYFSTVNSGQWVESVQSIRGYARYLCHLDNPEKAQYPIESVVSIYGADYNSIIGLAIDKYKAIREMQEWCIENNIVSFYRLCDYAMENRYDWYRVLCDSGVFMREYLKSRRDISVLKSHLV